jgi:uncharacterized protein YigA (DUF484 family)
MSTQPKASTAGVKTERAYHADEVQVAEFLRAHPEFFERHTALVAGLRLPHLRGDGSTVSLIERQIEVLRERARELELRLKTLVDNGRANDQLNARIHLLAKRLIRAREPINRLAAVEASLREDFEAHEFVVLMFRRDPALTALESRSLRFVAPSDAALKSFGSLLSSGRPRCGQVRDSNREYLFPNSSVAIGSVALVPLGPGGELGLLAIGSPDADHFNPTMSTDYLARIGELVATALA